MRETRGIFLTQCEIDIIPDSLRSSLMISIPHCCRSGFGLRMWLIIDAISKRNPKRMHICTLVDIFSNVVLPELLREAPRGTEWRVLVSCAKRQEERSDVYLIAVGGFRRFLRRPPSAFQRRKLMCIRSADFSYFLSSAISYRSRLISISMFPALILMLVDA